MSFYKERGYKDLVYIKDIFDFVGTVQRDRIHPNKLKAFCDDNSGWYKYKPSKGSLLKTTFLFIIKKASEGEYVMDRSSFGKLYSRKQLSIPPIIKHYEYTMGEEEYVMIPTKLEEVLVWKE